MNERLVVEQGLLVTMLIKFVRGGASELFWCSSLDTGRELHAAAKEIIGQAPTTSRGKIARRVASIGNRCVVANLPVGTKAAVLGLAVYFLLEHLLEQEYLVIGEASPLGRAVDLILPHLESEAAVEGNMSKARAMAAAIFADVQSQGLFRDVGAMT